MYDPFSAPNNYRRCKVAAYRKQQEQEREDAERKKTSPNFLTDALSAFSSAGSPSSMSPADASQFPAAPVALNASAEELHRQRVSRSAAMGISSAVALEREALEVEHKKRRLDGTDTKSRISSMLSRMRKPTTPATDATSNDGTAVPTGGADAVTAGPSPMTAPLVFKPSPLAAGGYVMVAGDTAAPARGPTMGKPSSTLLLRWTDASPMEVIRQREGDARSAALGELAEQARAECGRHGVVRSARAHLLTEDEEATLAGVIHAMTTDPAERERRLASERLRVLVRFDTVAEAFKTAEELRRMQRPWSICFYPTAAYDAGRSSPADKEPLCSG